MTRTGRAIRCPILDADALGFRQHHLEHFMIMPRTTPGAAAVPADAFAYRDLGDGSGCSATFGPAT